MALVPPGRRGDALERAVDFILAHRVFFSHTTGRPVRKFWPPQIHEPAHYSYDLLQPLRALALAKTPLDLRLDGALDLLEERADAKARWRVDVASPVIPIDPLARPAKWAAAAALAVLLRFERLSMNGTWVP